jgi:hypothetical protein
MISFSRLLTFLVLLYRIVFLSPLSKTKERKREKRLITMLMARPDLAYAIVYFLLPLPQQSTALLANYHHNLYLRSSVRIPDTLQAGVPTRDYP